MSRAAAAWGLAALGAAWTLSAAPAAASDPIVALANGSTGYLVVIEVPPFADPGEIEVVYDFDGAPLADPEAIDAATRAICARDRAHILGVARRAHNLEPTRIDMRFRWKTFAGPGTSWSAEFHAVSFDADCAPAQ